MHVEVVQLGMAPREKVFQAWVDYETRPKWDALFTSVTLTKRDGNTVHLATEMKIMGRRFPGTEIHTLTPPEEDRSEAESQSSTAKSVWRFASVPEGTQVTWIAEVEVKGVLANLFGPFAKRRIQAIVRHELHDLGKYVVTRGQSPGPPLARAARR